MAIEPDKKDWTWVLERPCAECGFDASTFPRDEIASLVRQNARSWQGVLARPEELLRHRAHHDRWSPLEYACHVRDVFRLYDFRLDLMLVGDSPTYPNWDQDRTAIDARYNDQDPARVAADLAIAAENLAVGFGSVTGPAWELRGVRSDGAAFTIDSLGRYMVHDPVDHLFDVLAAMPTDRP
jgi:hypothetical protein